MSYMPFKQTAFDIWKGSSGHQQGWSKAFDTVGDSMTLFPPQVFFFARGLQIWPTCAFCAPVQVGSGALIGQCT